ncbi:MAG: hypothetical protein WCK96_02115 [Methylococcales bacterium]
MKKILGALSIAILMSISAQAFATPEEDAAWIAKCEKDNAKEGAAAGTVTKYCSCMNNKMSEDEKKSITEWEKSHGTEMKACEAEAGWK